MHGGYPARCGTQFVTDQAIKICYPCQLQLLHIASLAEYHIGIVFWWRNGASFCNASRMDEQNAMFDGVSLWKVNCVPILLHVSFYLIFVTKLWDMTFRRCMCKGRKGHANILDSKSSWYMTKEPEIDLPITIKWKRRISISDDMYSLLWVSDVILAIKGVANVWSKPVRMTMVMRHSTMHPTA